jgi:cellulose synthase/poly-beta-1,6-N-acetylglucosamine synthase-like glycosyltransferase
MQLFALIALIVQIAIVAEILWHGRTIQPLPKGGGTPHLPRLTVIVPACNEEATIGTAVNSMLGQDYPDYEVVLVNDRSTDRTGLIIKSLAEANPEKVQAVTVAALPTGWLGKNHALYTGYQHSHGEWILFTDADIHFHPSAFRWAVAYAEAEGLDHLTLTPRIICRGFWLRAFVSFFICSLWVGAKPYLANDPRRKQNGVGFGCFNLVRRTAYERAGTHVALSLRPDDDMMLGMRLKRAGCSQRVTDGSQLISVEWYPTLRAAVEGLEKNMFPFQGYSVARVLGLSALVTALLIAPPVLLFVASGVAQWMLAGLVGLQLAFFLYTNAKSGTTRGEAIGSALVYPAMAGLTLYTFWRSTFRTLRQGGIYWRGTFYPLAALKAQSGLEGLK